MATPWGNPLQQGPQGPPQLPPHLQMQLPQQRQQSPMELLQAAMGISLPGMGMMQGQGAMGLRQQLESPRGPFYSPEPERQIFRDYTGQMQGRQLDTALGELPQVGRAEMDATLGEAARAATTTQRYSQTVGGGDLNAVRGVRDEQLRLRGGRTSMPVGLGAIEGNAQIDELIRREEKTAYSRDKQHPWQPGLVRGIGDGTGPIGDRERAAAARTAVLSPEVTQGREDALLAFRASETARRGQQELVASGPGPGPSRPSLGPNLMGQGQSAREMRDEGAVTDAIRERAEGKASKRRLRMESRKRGLPTGAVMAEQAMDAGEVVRPWAGMTSRDQVAIHEYEQRRLAQAQINRQADKDEQSIKHQQEVIGLEKERVKAERENRQRDDEFRAQQAADAKVRDEATVARQERWRSGDEEQQWKRAEWEDARRGEREAAAREERKDLRKPTEEQKELHDLNIEKGEFELGALKQASKPSEQMKRRILELAPSLPGGVYEAGRKLGYTRKQTDTALGIGAAAPEAKTGLAGEGDQGFFDIPEVNRDPETGAVTETGVQHVQRIAETYDLDKITKEERSELLRHLRTQFPRGGFERMKQYYRPRLHAYVGNLAQHNRIGDLLYGYGKGRSWAGIAIKSAGMIRSRPENRAAWAK